MTLWTLAFLLFGALIVTSALAPRTPPPPQMILVQALEPQAERGSGGLPLLLLVVAVIAAITFF